ncbi:MAG: phage portal protein, partial [Lachnospiraceae bacterium]|nr:phage portal protein [Lachnospiraceae bacterium]
MIDDTILTKVPFTRITPRGYLKGQIVSDLKPMRVRADRMNYKVVSQSDFLREYFPSGHMINSEEYYPDRIKYDEENKRFFKESVFRAAFPFQMIITIQHLVHLFGNDVRHELTDGKMDEKTNELFLEFQKGWLDHNIDIALYELGKSVKITGDGALVFYLLDGKVHTKPLSFLEGDTLYPHYNSITGKLDMFARQFVDYDADAKERVVWVEVWDNEYMYTYRQDKQGLSGAINRVKEFFGLSGYSLVSTKKHGFSRIPIVYHRDSNGACWSFSQDSIDKYELAISHLCQNNMAYAFPIMLLKGDDVEIQGDMYGAVKAITMGKEDDASFMTRPQASEEFNLQLTTLLKMIFMGSFIVMPPEVKSGDLPGVAIKLIYSPSLEKA